jgi:ribosomal protein S6
MLIFEPMARKYRLVLVLKSELKKEAKDKLLTNVKSWGGKISNDKITDLGEKKFAYPIKSAQKGDYVLMEFESESVSPELENKVRINDDILRHLLVRD